MQKHSQKKGISIIVPLYKGQKYVNRILNEIEININNLFAAYDFMGAELIFVNDYPDEVITWKNNCQLGIKIVLIQNPKNYGIHRSRVIGIENAQYDYIYMLDQDDMISDDFIVNQINKLITNSKYKAVICNGYEQYGNGYRVPIYKKMYKLLLCRHLLGYILFGNRIVSPGQVVLKKSCIPTLWKENILNNNGADDFFLMLIFLKENSFHLVRVNSDKLYVHVNHDVNTSNDGDSMKRSIGELIDILLEHKIFSKNVVNIICKRHGIS